MQIKTLPLTRVKAGPEDGLKDGEFLVYPSTFTKTPDAYNEVVAPGAFLEDIAAWKASGDVLPGLYGHRMDDPDFFVAEALDEGEDEHGWWVKGAFDLESPKGPQVYRLVKGRRLRQLSFAYDVLDAGIITLDGQEVTELRKLKRYEFSFVPVGANQDTSVVAVKGILDTIAQRKALDAVGVSTLTEARDTLNSVLEALEGDQTEDDQEKASEADEEEKATVSADELGDQEKAEATAEELKSGNVRRTLAAQAHLYALSSAGREMIRNG